MAVEGAAKLKTKRKAKVKATVKKGAAEESLAEDPMAAMLLAKAAEAAEAKAEQEQHGSSSGVSDWSDDETAAEMTKERLAGLESTGDGACRQVDTSRQVDQLRAKLKHKNAAHLKDMREAMRLQGCLEVGCPTTCCSML